MLLCQCALQLAVGGACQRSFASFLMRSLWVTTRMNLQWFRIRRQRYRHAFECILDVSQRERSRMWRKRKHFSRFEDPRILASAYVRIPIYSLCTAFKVHTCPPLNCLGFKVQTHITLPTQDCSGTRPNAKLVESNELSNGAKPTALRQF